MPHQEGLRALVLALVAYEVPSAGYVRSRYQRTSENRQVHTEHMDRPPFSTLQSGDEERGAPSPISWVSIGIWQNRVPLDVVRYSRASIFAYIKVERDFKTNPALPRTSTFPLQLPSTVYLFFFSP